MVVGESDDTTLKESGIGNQRITLIIQTKTTSIMTRLKNKPN